MSKQGREILTNACFYLVQMYEGTFNTDPDDGDAVELMFALMTGAAPNDYQ